MKNKSLIRVVSALLLVAMLVGFMPISIMDKSYAAALNEKPKRERPEPDELWTLENLWRTFSYNNSNPVYYNSSNRKYRHLNHITNVGSAVYMLDSQKTDVPGVDGVGLLNNIVQVTDGLNRYYLDANGRVYSIGSGKGGALGNGSTADSFVNPVLVKGVNGVGYLEDIVQIAAYGYSGNSVGGAYALDSEGNVYAWGGNSRGSIGDGTTVNRLTPVKVPGLPNNIIKIIGARFYGMALAEDGSVYRWGNGSGMFTSGDSTYESIPEKIDTLPPNIVDISPNLFLTSDGKVYRANGTQIRIGENKSFVTDAVGIGNNIILLSDGTAWTLVDHSETSESLIARNWLVEKIKDNIVAVNGTVVMDRDGNVYYGHRVKRKSSPYFPLPPGEIIASINIPKTITIPDYQLYKFEKPTDREILEGGKEVEIKWSLISDPVKSFDIYYAKNATTDDWTDESTWIEIEKEVPVSVLNPIENNSDFPDGKGGYLKQTNYTYRWFIPNEFLGEIKLIIIPNYY